MSCSSSEMMLERPWRVEAKRIFRGGMTAAHAMVLYSSER
jgi:hypothetical protein